MEMEILILLLFNYVIVTANNDELCERKPLSTKAQALPPDNRFQISIDGIVNDKYIPTESYKVRLFSTDQKSTFIAFMISAIEDTEENPKNIRIRKPLFPGRIIKSDDGIQSELCSNTVIQSNISPKTSVEVLWLAPKKNQGCVKIYALVAVKQDVWYDRQGPLIKEVCEDRRQKDDMQPSFNNNCTVCDDARYLLIFEGLWKYNTHPNHYPQNKNLARFSDLIGASHNNQFELWKFNKEASDGLTKLAQQGNTTDLETEIQKHYKSGVRTIIKAKGQPHSNSSTMAIFRASRDYHRISFVAAILPSPDWFLGVANLELCTADSKWADKITLNLYPLDAGTDSGTTFEAPNDETSPPQPIDVVFSDGDKSEANKLKPFAQLQLQLIRTYHRNDCAETTERTGDYTTDSYEQGNGDESGESTYEPKIPVKTSDETPTVTPTIYYPSLKDTECPMTEWEEWLPCSGICTDNVFEGYQSRTRYHIVDGVAVGKFTENSSIQPHKEVPEKCRRRDKDTFETRPCQEECKDESVTEPWQPPALEPGQDWNQKT